MPRLGIVGAGRIARTVIDAVLNGGAGDWQLVGILARQAGTRDGIGAPIENTMSDFLRHAPDLIVRAEIAPIGAGRPLFPPHDAPLPRDFRNCNIAWGIKPDFPRRWP